MSEVKAELKYTEEHEWIRLEGDTAIVGITDHAQGELGDIVFVELPEVGEKVSQGDSIGTIEAVKTVAEIYSPIDGEIIEINESLSDAAEVINSDAYGDGWIAKIRIADASSADALMDAEAYKAHIA